MKIQRNTLYTAGLEERPVYEQTLLLHVDKLLCYMQYDGLTNEDRHYAFNVAAALLSLFGSLGIAIPQHYIQWINELAFEINEL